MGTLRGRVALVTGASRGIGAAIARRLAAEGAAVALTARTLESHDHLPGSLEQTHQAIEAAGGRCITIPADLLSATDRARIVEETVGRLGPVEILVNNAAASFYRPFAAWTEKRFRIAFEINVRAPFDLAQRVVPGMREAGEGWIVNLSSATASASAALPYDEFEKSGGDLLYGMTKAALDRFSRGLAAELFDAGICVNSVAPVAAVSTPGVEALGIVPDAFIESAEPMEVMVEAAVALCESGAPTGLVATSLALLEELDRPVRSLDAERILGRARDLVAVAARKEN